MRDSDTGSESSNAGRALQRIHESRREAHEVLSIEGAGPWCRWLAFASGVLPGLVLVPIDAGRPVPPS
jgi:hypothetical protein